MNFLEIAGLIVLGTFALMFLIGFTLIFAGAVQKAIRGNDGKE